MDIWGEGGDEGLAVQEQAKADLMQLVQKYGPAVIGGLAGGLFFGKYLGSGSRRAMSVPFRQSPGLHTAGAIGGSGIGAMAGDAMGQAGGAGGAFEEYSQAPQLRPK